MQTTAKPLSRDAIKYIAMFFMLCNHAANIFCPLGVFPWQVIADLGYFTAITMCFFLVEGYRRTSSPRKYGQRLLIFALLAQLPTGWPWRTTTTSICSSLFCCVSCCWWALTTAKMSR